LTEEEDEAAKQGKKKIGRGDFYGREFKKRHILPLIILKISTC
jgi:hypothetical protein